MAASRPTKLSFLPTYSTAVSDGVYKFLNGFIFGAIWGAVTPFHAPGSIGAARELKTGIFKAAPPFSSFKSMYSNGIMVGSLMGVFGLSSKTLEVARQKSDMWNSIFACGVTYSYHSYFLGSSEKRLMLHNRFVGAFVLSSVLYANVVL